MVQFYDEKGGFESKAGKDGGDGICINYFSRLHPCPV
jgi:hypothetical protein